MASDVTPETLPLSIDLIEQALYHIDFLAKVDSIQELKQHAILVRALYRYETYWLPLAAEHSDECLSAPLDIEWIWHCHLLSPKCYAIDCKAITNDIVRHTLRSQKDYKLSLEKSQAYWKQKYGDIPFFVDLKQPEDPPVPDGFQTKVTYEVIEAAGRQKVLFYQISLPHYKDRKYLEGSLLRYRQFLYLKTKHPKTFSVPCFEMDLMWHTHLVNPLLYRKDTSDILGFVFNHDDTVNDRSEGSELNRAQAETTEQWTILFNEPFSSPGAMYRGQPPGGILYKLSEEEINGVSTKTATVSLNSLTLRVPLESELDEYKSIKISAHGCAGTRNIRKWFSLNKKKQNTNERTIDFEVQGESLNFDTKSMNNINLEIETNAGKFACFGRSKEALGNTVYNMLPKIENNAKVVNGTIQTTQTLSDGSSVTLKCSISKPARGPALMFLQAGSEEAGTIPGNVKSLLGPVNLERLHSHTDNSCLITLIRLKNHMGKTDFTGKIIYSQPLMLHFIQIFHHDKMVAVCHQIGCEQLPSPTQVENDIITLNHGEGERALLIKNHAGDWGIVKGKMLRKEAQAVHGIKEPISGNCRRLWLYLYKMATGSCENTILEFSQNRSTVTLDSTKIDLRKGSIEAESATMEVGERIALAFCVSLLQKMLLPKVV